MVQANDTGQILGGSDQCISCRWYVGGIRPGVYACEAFIRGIPLKILRGEIDHRTPHPNDNGIQWEESAIWRKFYDEALAE
jgi:hypothetical protein